MDSVAVWLGLVPKQVVPAAELSYGVLLEVSGNFLVSWCSGKRAIATSWCWCVQEGVKLNGRGRQIFSLVW